MTGPPSPPPVPASGRGPAGSLTRTAARGFTWSFGGGVAQALLGIVSISALSHLLTREQVGATTAAGIVIGFSGLLSQLGVGPALVQRKGLREEDVAAAVVFSAGLSLVLAAAVLLLAPWLNVLVGLPSSSSLVRVLALSLFLGGLSAVPAGLLQRRLVFRATSVVDVLAAGPVSIGVSVVLAVLGFGSYSIAWGSVASSLTTVVGYTVLARPALRAQRPAEVWHRVRPLLRFGSAYSISQFGNYLALNADNLATVHLLGTGALGTYGRAYRLLSQPANLIGGAADKVLFPAMAKVRDQPERLRGAYVRANSLVALVAVPASALLLVLAPEVVHLLLGSRWDDVIFPLQVFALVLLPRASYKISGSLTRATGAVYGGALRQWLYAGEVAVGAAVGAHWGVGGVAVGASAAIVLHYLVMLRFSARIAPGLVGQVLRMLAVKHLPTAVITIAVTAGAATALRPLDVDLLTLGGAAVCGAAAAVATTFLRRRTFAEELGVLDTLVRRRTAPGREPSVSVRH